LPLIFAVALAATFAVTPVAIAVAHRARFLDQPTGYKRHAGPTPYLGGAAVLGGVLVAVGITATDLDPVAPILGCAALLWAVGTIDDRRTVRPSLRVTLELAVAVFLWTLDLGWSVFGSELLNVIVTGAWIVAVVNSFNLMDNMDGAATTVGAVTAGAVGAAASLDGEWALAALSLGLAGACCGFLPYNLARPARIFLGDGGSLPIGFVIGATIMALPGADPIGWPYLCAATLLIGLPVVDTALVLISRRRRREPLFRGGRDHLTHRILTFLESPRDVALTLALLQGFLVAAAVATIQLGRGSILVAGTLWFVLAASSVALLETRAWAPQAVVAPPSVDSLESDRGGRRRTSLVEAGLVVFITAACALSPLLYGFYDLSVWGPIGLGALAALLGLLIARPAAPSRSGLVALAGLVGLSAWSFVSTRWAESAGQALVEANRWMLYAAFLAVLILLVRDDRLGRLLLIAATCAILVLALYLTAVLLSARGPELFVANRLSDPLGYVNGQAGFLLLGFWPLVAAAERGRAVVAGAAAAGAALLGCLVLLAQTRAVLPALVISALVLLLAVPGRVRRAWLLILVLGAVLAALDPLLAVYDSGELAPDADALRRAVLWALAMSAICGAIWGGVTAATARVESHSKERRRGRHVAVAGLVVMGVIGGGALIAAIADPVEKTRSEWRAFKDLGATSGDSSRLISGGGARYDYWRIAVNQFERKPLVGVGAGNYDLTYFRERRTAENIKQPHSLELQTMAELGVVGFAVLALFIVGVLSGAVRRVRMARQSHEAQGTVVAAGGLFLVWLVHTSVDWLHLIPGLTGLALCAAAVLVGPWRRDAAPTPTNVRRAAVVSGAILVLLGAALLGRSVLAELYREDGVDALATRPAVALAKSQDSLELNDEALPAYYLQAAAYARLDRYAEARRALLEASRREPSDPVPWALLGDLATRRGSAGEARRYYARAARLDPRNSSIEENFR
jgi:UDP-N-acetylmuramyl pentapeptide phosphotransferase/UDP-N-acetylglucosamine-1-phosphate transferase